MASELALPWPCPPRQALGGRGGGVSAPPTRAKAPKRKKKNIFGPYVVTRSARPGCPTPSRASSSSSLLSPPPPTGRALAPPPTHPPPQNHVPGTTSPNGRIFPHRPPKHVHVGGVSDGMRPRYILGCSCASRRPISTASIPLWLTTTIPTAHALPSLSSYLHTLQARQGQVPCLRAWKPRRLTRRPRSSSIPCLLLSRTQPHHPHPN